MTPTNEVFLLEVLLTTKRKRKKLRQKKYFFANFIVLQNKTLGKQLTNCAKRQRSVVILDYFFHFFLFFTIEIFVEFPPPDTIRKNCGLRQRIMGKQLVDRNSGR